MFLMMRTHAQPCVHWLKYTTDMSRQFFTSNLDLTKLSPTKRCESSYLSSFKTFSIICYSFPEHKGVQSKLYEDVGNLKEESEIKRVIDRKTASDKNIKPSTGSNGKKHGTAN